MYLMYIDESGDTIPLSQKGSSFFVLAGVIIFENDKPKIELEFRTIKDKYYNDPNIEIKSNFLRYANPNLTQKSPLKLKDKEEYDDLELNITNFLKKIPILVCSVVINKHAYWKKLPARDLYQMAYTFLIERFQTFLAFKQKYGLCIIDPREGRVEKHYIGSELDKVHDILRWNNSEHSKKCPNIIERLLFSQSDRTIGIQIADLYCYPIFHIFEYNKKKIDYWRYRDITEQKLWKPDGSTIEDKLIFYPLDSKKGLKYFETRL